MIENILLILLGLTLFAVGTFILGCRKYVGYVPRHMLRLIDREALLHYAIRYSNKRTALVLCAILILVLFARQQQ